MDIIVRKRGKSYTPSKFKGKMSVGERQALKEKQMDLEAQLKDISADTALHDKPGVVRQLGRIKEMLAEDEDKSAKGSERGRLEAQKKELEEYIRLNVPPLSLQNARPGTPEYDEAVRWGMKASSPEVVQKCERYKDICRRLDPTDPSAGSVDTLVSKG